MTYLTEQTKKTLPISDIYHIEGKELVVKELHRYRCESCIIIDFEVEDLQGLFRIPRFQDFDIENILKILVFNWDFIDFVSTNGYDNWQELAGPKLEIRAGGLIHVNLFHNPLQSNNHYHKIRPSSKKTFPNIPAISIQFPNVRHTGIGICTLYLIQNNSLQKGKERVSEFFQFYPYNT